MKKSLSILLAILMVATMMPLTAISSFAADSFPGIGGIITIKKGWVFEKGKWAYYENGFKVRNTWKKDSVGWCYLDSDGYMATNKWVEDSVGWCYVGEDGHCLTNQWFEDDSQGWCYLDANGRRVTNKWFKDSVGWCYVGAAGFCVKNAWAKDSVGWCYLDANGYLAKNKWAKDSVGWCYVDSNGYMITNQWKTDSVGWCYVDGSGRAVTSSWLTYNGKKYYLDSDAHMVTGTRFIDGAMYDFDENGVLIGSGTQIDVVGILNSATAKAVNSSYSWSRESYYTKPIDMGNSTDALNSIIQNVDSNATVDSVVGSFLGIGSYESTVTNGKPGEAMSEKHLLKAFNLTNADIKELTLSGNTYKIKIYDANNPQKDGNNGLNRVTNDFITLEEVQASLTEAVGEAPIAVDSCDIDYSSIIVEAVIEDDCLVSLDISYIMTVNALNLKVSVMPIKATGECFVQNSYTNFVY